MLIELKREAELLKRYIDDLKREHADTYRQIAIFNGLLEQFEGRELH
jgi:hypothetical protein